MTKKTPKAKRARVGKDSLTGAKGKAAVAEEPAASPINTAADGAGGASAPEVTAPPASTPPATSNPKPASRSSRPSPSSSEAVGQTKEAGSAQKNDQRDVLIVTAKRDIWRGRIHWQKGVTRVEASRLDKHQLAAIESEPALKIERVVE